MAERMNLISMFYECREDVSSYAFVCLFFAVTDNKNSGEARRAPSTMSSKKAPASGQRASVKATKWGDRAAGSVGHNFYDKQRARKYEH